MRFGTLERNNDGKWPRDLLDGIPVLNSARLVILWPDGVVERVEALTVVEDHSGEEQGGGTYQWYASFTEAFVDLHGLKVRVRLSGLNVKIAWENN